MSRPVETKVSAAAIASAVTGLGLWALQTYVFRGDVPLPVLAAVQTVVPAAITFAAGYLAPHTPRPDLRCDRTWRDAPDDGDHESWGGETSEFTPGELADARGAVVPSVDSPVDKPGRHER